MFKLSTTSSARMVGVNPDWFSIVKLGLEISKIDFGIPEHGGVRTEEEQNKLYRDGDSKADGYDTLSNHQDGQALDVFAFIDGKASWEPAHLAMVATALLQAASILGIRLSWGGLWSSNKLTNGIPYGWDMAHFELLD